MTNKTVAVVGGGFSGALFALKMARARPDWTCLMIDRTDRLGRGLAYGAAGPHHILNVPVNRMEVGLQPNFLGWLSDKSAALDDALAESEGVLENAFVPRRLFGDYIEEQVNAALKACQNLRHIHDDVVAISEGAKLHLADGGTVPADLVVLATGNLPPRLPFRAAEAAARSPRYVPDPWARNALDSIAADAPVLFLGAGLTMIDTLLTLKSTGHGGALFAISRHGLLPRSHQGGGQWKPFLDEGSSPLSGLRTVRAELRAARQAGIPWQRVFDAVRPSVASIWRGWSDARKKQFLRHLRAVWDAHRHRMPARIDKRIQGLIAEGTLEIIAGKVIAFDERANIVTAVVRPRGAELRLIKIAHVINCTGPQTDLAKSPRPLFADLRAQGLIVPDALGLGLESEDGAVAGGRGWLFALGPLTRPAWWEITAVPEINAQVDRLVATLANDNVAQNPLHAIFLDIGAGI